MKYSIATFVILAFYSVWLLLLISEVKSDARASFQDYLPPRFDGDSPTYDDSDYSIHDADVKIPGRFFPKTAYINPTLEGAQDGLDSSPRVNRDPGNPNLPRYDEDSGRMVQEEATNPQMGPHFDRSLVRNITVQAGKTAELFCKVREISQKSVSWIRLRDLHILSVDKYKYNTDERISVEFDERKMGWVLRIQRAKNVDAGKYECQVSTKPVLSFIVNLAVVAHSNSDDEFEELLTKPEREKSDRLKQASTLTSQVPRAYIVNSPDIHVHHGSLINLTCVINHGKNQPVYIYWYHQNKLVDLDKHRQSVKISTPSSGQTVSQLLVRGARLLDSGKYACKPSNGDKALATLHVLRGEQRAAMQTNSVQCVFTSCLALFLLIALTLSL